MSKARRAELVGCFLWSAFSFSGKAPPIQTRFPIEDTDVTAGATEQHKRSPRLSFNLYMMDLFLGRQH